MIPRHLAVLAIAVALADAASAARTTVIDDSGTLPYNANSIVRWQTLAPARGKRNDRMEGTATIQLRLDVRPWLDRNGRIFLVMPAQPPGPVQASWTTQGRLLAGQMTSGTRALVYAGPITAPAISEVLQLKIVVDGTQMWQAYQLRFHFEMDED
ncbi:MAG: hypothetical protein U1F41_06755 [Burkholderiales bacterium]